MALDIQRATDRRSASRRALTVVAGSLLIITALLFTGCKDSDDADTTPAKPPAAGSPVTTSAPSKGLIKADPNPVPAGPGDLGKTTISWNTQTAEEPVQITVSTNGEEEVGFSGGAAQGAMEAPWIQSAGVYDFKLYVGAGANRKLIDHVAVTRNK